MFGWTDRQRRRRTLEERRVRNFLHQSRVVRVLIALVATAILMLLCMSSARLDPLNLTVGQISPRTIVARANFDFPDQHATEELRQRKAGGTPSVYRLSLEDYRRDWARVRRLFDHVKEIRQGGKISEKKLKEVADAWSAGGGISLSPAEVQTLLFIPDRERFLSGLESLSGRLAEEGILGDDQLSNPDTLIAYSVHPEEFSQLRYARAGQFSTVRQARQKLLDTLVLPRVKSAATVKTFEKLFAGLLTPDLQLDAKLSERLREKHQRGVNTIYRSITRGNVLIERGERLTEEKLVMLKAHEAEAEREFSRESRWHQRVGIGGLVLVVLAATVVLLSYQRRGDQPRTNREYGLLATVLVLQIGLCRLAVYLADGMWSLSPSLVPSILPYCFGPMLVAPLISRRHGNVVAIASSLLLGIIHQFHFGVMLTSLISSVAGVSLLGELRRRARIYEAGLVAGVSAALLNIVFGFMWDVSWNVIGLQCGLSVAVAFGSSLLIMALLPMFEAIFKVTTGLRWLEWADLNHPLLRRMVMEAPGTYHHSLVVANLAERACEKIGAHALQARVCSYFHDIGKLQKPDYFCENQPAGENPHDDIPPNMSALVIIAHVKDGVDMAIQHRMPRQVLDTIQQHHGTSQVSFFYRRAKRNAEDVRLGSKILRTNVSDVPRVEEETYCYPGPKPCTREIGIISLADAVEGASRSMLKPTPQKIETLVQEILDERCREGQLDECPLTLREMHLIAESFSKTILSMMHTRVRYPKDEPDIDQPAPFPSAASS